MSGTLQKFWSDDFDMDLLKLFPDLPAELGEAAELPIWTVGHSTYGRLNSPAQWNSHGAYAWAEKPQLVRDKHGWFNIHGCVSNDELIEATWLEFLRDMWPHSYAFILLPHGVLFEQSPRLVFDRIMYHIRAWRNSENLDADLRQAKSWVLMNTAKFERLAPRASQ